jgi:NADH-quinone oxidoreductase subunit C
VSKKLLERLQSQFGDAIIETHSDFGDDTAVVDPARWVEIATFLRDDPRCSMDHFIDITVVDYLGRRTPRYEVVLHLRSLDKLHRIRLKARLDAKGDAKPKIDTLSGVWRGADWFEREAFDMFGVDFVGHPDLRRILMYEEFEGYPLRKDYPAQRTQPLIPYRDVPNIDKLPPFGEREGLPWGRQTHDHSHAERNLLGFEEDS